MSHGQDIPIDSGERRAPRSNGAAARRLAADAGSVVLTAEFTRLNTDFFANMPTFT